MRMGLGMKLSASVERTAESGRERYRSSMKTENPSPTRSVPVTRPINHRFTPMPGVNQIFPKANQDFRRSASLPGDFFM
jgi:hypothetical protein